MQLCSVYAMGDVARNSSIDTHPDSTTDSAVVSRVMCPLRPRLACIRMEAPSLNNDNTAHVKGGSATYRSVVLLGRGHQ
jgi:hypothetical protein